MLTLVLLFIQLLVLGILIWGVCEYIRLRHLLCNINRRMTMDIDGVIDGLLEADDASYHAATKHDTKYQRHAGPEGTHGGDGEATGTATTSQQVVQQHRDRLARLAAGGRARQYIVKALSGRRYGGGGWEALRPLRGSALSSDDKSPGGSCPPAIHICGQHVSTNTPWGAARATIRTGGRPLHWARGQPDNKSLGCCCRNSLPTVINPLNNNCKTRRKTFKYWDLVRLVLCLIVLQSDLLEWVRRVTPISAHTMMHESAISKKMSSSMDVRFISQNQDLRRHVL